MRVPAQVPSGYHSKDEAAAQQETGRRLMDLVAANQVQTIHQARASGAAAEEPDPVKWSSLVVLRTSVDRFLS